MSASEGAVADYAVLDGTGSFMLYLPAGRYRLYAVCDFNGDGSFGEDEICGLYGASPDTPKEIVLQEGVVAKGVEIAMSRTQAGRIKPPGRLDYAQIAARRSGSGAKTARSSSSTTSGSRRRMPQRAGGAPPAS